MEFYTGITGEKRLMRGTSKEDYAAGRFSSAEARTATSGLSLFDTIPRTTSSNCLSVRRGRAGAGSRSAQFLQLRLRAARIVGAGKPAHHLTKITNPGRLGSHLNLSQSLLQK